MASIPQINNPITGKSYSSNLSGRNTANGEERFDLIQLSSPLEVQNSTERQAGNERKPMTGQKDFMSMSVKIAKDPTMAVESLKQIINEDLLTIVKANGYTELHGELDSLMKGLYLNSSNLVNDIISQEKQNTLFSGNKFFDLLRKLASTAAADGNEELKNSIGNLLKAINFMQNKDEILNALSSNMKFLSQYFTPNKNLSEGLLQLSQSFKEPDAGEDFEFLKNQTLFILKNVSESLLNNEQTQILIPLIIHNISRYNANDEMITDNFAVLLAQIPDTEMQKELLNAFESLLKSMMSGRNSNYVTNETTPLYNNTTNFIKNQPLEEHFNKEIQIPEFLRTSLSDENYISKLDYNREALNAPVTSYLLGKSNGMEAVNETLNLLINDNSMKQVLVNELKQIGTIDALVDYLNQILQNLPDNEERQFIYENLVEIINNIAENKELPSTADELIPMTNEQTDEFDGIKKQVLSDDIEDSYEPGQRQTEKHSQNNIHNDNDIDDFRFGDGKKHNIRSAEEYAEANRIKTSNENDERSENKTTLKALIDFVDKNIDHSALKTINNYNASNLLQSLINAPGVFTPLAHYIIPLQIEDSKAFGELWVDNDEENATAEANKKKYHLFLTFEVEQIGRFEIDMFARGEEVNISFLHPENFAARVDPIIRKVNRIIAQSGYITKNFKTAPLVKPHNLTQVFPHINEKRGGFNVKA